MDNDATRSDPLPQLSIFRAHHGRIHYTRTGWSGGSQPRWVIDIMIGSGQDQRINDGPIFVRSPGSVVLYAPGTRYREHITRAGHVMQSWVTFHAADGLDAALRELTGEASYCHFRDPGAAIAERLERLGSIHLQGNPRHLLAQHGILLEIIGLLSAATPIARREREVRDPSQNTGGWLGDVEAEILDRLHEPLRVVDLADSQGCSESTFAHRYTRAAGESPYQAILRLKMAEAKRLLATGHSVSDVATALGYASPYSFSRAFKSHTGLAPLPWRRSAARD